MTPFTVLSYLFGRPRAIREVASDRAALVTGIGLVLLTGIARNYDQNYFLETPMWLIGPLVFSFFSGSFLYAVVIRGFSKRHNRPDCVPCSQWRTFMSLFWMTAPIAWLYAIPVERFLKSYHAAIANLTLLGIVSLWRVLLMSRILEVLLAIRFRRAVSWVLVAASAEVILVVFFGSIGNGSVSRSIMAGMSGMRHAPEETLINNALGAVWIGSWAMLVICLVLLASFRFQGLTNPLPTGLPGKIPWAYLAATALIWILLAVPAQQEQKRFLTQKELIDHGRYSEALKYLENFRKSDFPATRRLEPNPYEFNTWQDLPPTVASLSSNTPPWIRQVYLSHLRVMLSHHYTGYESLTNVASMFSAIEHLPEGREWISTNQINIARQGLRKVYGSYHSSESVEMIASTNIVNTLRRMGMSEDNLNEMTR